MMYRNMSRRLLTLRQQIESDQSLPSGGSVAGSGQRGVAYPDSYIDLPDVRCALESTVRFEAHVWMTWIALDE